MKRSEITTKYLRKQTNVLVSVFKCFLFFLVFSLLKILFFWEMNDIFVVVILLIWLISLFEVCNANKDSMV